MDIHEVGPDHPLYQVFQSLRQKMQPKRKLFRVMDDEDIKGYNEIEALRKEANLLNAKFETLSQKFMLDLKVKYGVFDKDLHVNTDTQHLEVSDEVD